MHVGVRFDGVKYFHSLAVGAISITLRDEREPVSKQNLTTAQSFVRYLDIINELLAAVHE